MIKRINKFAIFLKQLRNKEGISQRELSRRLGLSLMMVRDYENGKKIPRSDNVKKIASYFGLRAEELQQNVQVARFYNRGGV